jgi:site-specific DNA-methyltransferase (adenine-specific)
VNEKAYMDINLRHGDCLELMKDIPDKSVDLILTDPPYNIGKAKWDKIPNYVEWCGKWFVECQRVLKDNGSFYWWHNDMVQIAQLMEWLRVNTGFVFNSFVIWDKGDFRALSWKNPSENNNLRSWFNTCEYCLYYTFQDETGLSKVLKNPAFYGLQEYFKTEREKTGMTATALDKIMGIKASYCYWEKPTTHEYRIPDEKNYNALQSYFGENAFCREYESLRQEYESLRQEYESLRYTHNLDTNHNNVWRSQERNNGKQHPTQKPIDLMERIIKTSSNQGDTVLDLFMGSGSTGVACMNTNRNFIGIELDDKYFEIAKQRISEARNKPEQMSFLIEPVESL